MLSCDSIQIRSGDNGALKLAESFFHLSTTLQELRDVEDQVQLMDKRYRLALKTESRLKKLTERVPAKLESKQMRNRLFKRKVNEQLT